MRVINVNVMRGPNFWSNYRKKLIVVKLDLEEDENFPTNKIDGFAIALENLLPSMKSHRCSEGRENGFFDRVKEGTWLGHVVEHIALELQSLAGMECGFGRTRSTNVSGVYHVVFSYVIETAGIYAAHAAINIVEHLRNNLNYNIAHDLEELRRIYNNEKLGPSTLSIVHEAEKHNIPWTQLNNDSLVMLGQGSNQKIVCATVACSTSNIAVDIASDKENTRQLLSKSYIPVPKGLVLENETELFTAIKELGFPLVIKPINGNHGRGITTRIYSEEQALVAFNFAKQVSDEIIIEKFIRGNDYRFLVIDYKLVAVAQRIPAMIMGNFKGSTIQQLIDETNSDPNRGNGHDNILTKITIDENTQGILVKKNLTLDSVLPIGEILYLKDTANLSSGGTARDLTDSVHPHNVFLAERIARLMNLDICGIDVIAKDVNSPISEASGAVIEVNAGPGFRMHIAPSVGQARNVAESVINMLYKENAPARIPVVAVTGTNGKTTVTRLIAHMAKTAGQNVGYTTTDGIYINENPITYGDCSGPESAAVVLRDPLVDYAVLECARGGILRTGLGFDKCNISIVTNVTEDHLGLNDINTLEQLATVKAVVPNSTMDDGFAILNADDERVYTMRNNLDCNIALFSINPENSHVIEHCKNGGLAAIVEKNYFVICKGEYKTRLARVNEVPLTLNGKANCMIKNILPVVLSGVISNFSKEHIINAIKTFYPTPENNPGRMNIFEFKNFQLMLDYAHNTDGFLQLKKYIFKVKSPLKIGIIAASGDRRDEDIRMMGIYAAQVFDKIIIRHDENGRGRTNEELTELLLQGIFATNEYIEVKVISDETEAILYAVNNSMPGAFIFVCSDNIRNSIEYVQYLQRSEIKNLTKFISNSTMEKSLQKLLMN